MNAARTKLFERHLPLVKAIAGEMRRRLSIPLRIQRDELESAGMVGLMRSAGRFKPSRGTAFITYAAPRIRGAIIDWMRDEDWRTRTQVRDAARRAEEGEKPPVMLSIDGMGDLLRSPRSDMKAIDDAESFDRILRPLPREMKTIVTLYWRDGLTMREIGQAIGIGYSRVSQLHTAAMGILREETQRKSA